MATFDWVYLYCCQRGDEVGVKLALLGASGALGQRVVEQVLERGHTVTVLVRHPEKFDDHGGKIRVVKGDALHREDIVKVVAGADTVISTLGGPPQGTAVSEKELLHHGTEALIVAMESTGVKRLIYTSAWGVGDSLSHTTLMFRYFIRPVILKNEYNDKEIQEKLITKSNLDWTLVRPSVLTNASDTAYEAAHFLRFSFLHNTLPPMISRSAVAHFILDEVESSNYIKSSVMVTGGKALAKKLS